MTQIDTTDAPQDEYEDMAGGPGAPLPVAQLVVSPHSLLWENMSSHSTRVLQV